MSTISSIRLSTGFLPTGEFSHTVHHPQLPGIGLVVTSQREAFETTFDGFAQRNLFPDDDYIKETKEGLHFLLPPTIGYWPEQSLKAFLEKGIQPATAREVFDEIRKFISCYVWFPRVVNYDLASLLVLLSYWISIFPAVPIVEIRGCVASGKSTFGQIITDLCRSGLMCSHATYAAILRARTLDPCTLFFDEPIRKGSIAQANQLGSYKRDAQRLVCGPGNEFKRQASYGLTLEVFDTPSPALKSRTISIETAPALRRYPPYLKTHEVVRINKLVSNLFWLSLSLHESVLDEYLSFMSEAPVSNRAAEKWGPLVAISKVIDASDPDCKPISPTILSHLIDETQRERDEMNSTDPELLVLSGTHRFVKPQGDQFSETTCDIPATDLTEFLRGHTGVSLTIQQVGKFLRNHGVITKHHRSRKVGNQANGKPQHPQTIYTLDIPRLCDAVEVHGLNRDDEEDN